MTHNTSIKLSDEKLLQEFVAILLRKGYDGHFILQSLDPPAFYTGPVEICLQKFIAKFSANHPASVMITLTTDFQCPDRKPPFYAVLSTCFTSDNGWQINAITIKTMGQERASPVAVANTKEIPAFKSLPTISETPHRSALLRLLERLLPKKKPIAHQ
ncbi:hypothetical protein WJU16_02825 [Chitinophaga pollutisoli]|uniref:Uncharacterized protein n=1 Tax=Chitinophaga pollutisoli TaxID=3133966 RepID=A0ABZ2YQB5_9BACT